MKVWTVVCPLVNIKVKVMVEAAFCHQLNNSTLSTSISMHSLTDIFLMVKLKFKVNSTVEVKVLRVKVL